MWAKQGQVIGLAERFSDKRRSVGLSGGRVFHPDPYPNTSV